MKPTKFTHKNYILDHEPIRKNSVWPGHIVDFRYTSKNTGSDPRPLVFVVYRDIPKKLVHGVNLNYLTEFEVQKMFSFIRKIVPLNQEDKSARTLSETTTRFDIDKKDEKIPTMIYERVIKPKILKAGKNNCYRTYSEDKISSMRVIAYKIESDFRNWKGRYSDEENKIK
tara:strand:- start:183 stop:692 length:510 start_codon:yes stop_codon:yes gene_type:complete